MTLKRLIQYCLQYLEQDGDNVVLEDDIDELKTNDGYAEYINNIEHSIYMGLTRYASSNILPLKELELIQRETNVVSLFNNLPLIHKIKEVYAEDEYGNVVNPTYFYVGNKIKIKYYSPKYKYFLIYHPTINDLDTYVKSKDFDTIYDLELNDLNGEVSIPDEMAINLKYFVYSDLKMEDNPNIANINKNYFESYLDQMKTEQVGYVQTTYGTMWDDNTDNTEIADWDWK